MTGRGPPSPRHGRTGANPFGPCGGRAEGIIRCPGHCLNEESLEPCREKCECAFVRDILEKVRNWPKQRESIPV